MNPNDVANLIDMPLEDWPGHCYIVVCLMAKAKIVKGIVRYGDWIGPVASDTMFYNRHVTRPFIHHGWIELPDGQICDPTRYVFEGKDPYIYFGPSDFYDAGGNVWREQNLQPPPHFNTSERVFDFPHIETVIKYLSLPPYSFGQIFWLANLPLKMFEDQAKEIFQAIDEVGEGVLVPMDNWRIVMEK